MQTKQEQRLCHNCNEILPATKRVPSHILHLILSLLTAGMWLFIWLLVVILATTEKFKCIKCGSKTS